MHVSSTKKTLALNNVVTDKNPFLVADQTVQFAKTVALIICSLMLTLKTSTAAKARCVLMRAAQ